MKENYFKPKELLPDEVIIDFALGELYHQQGRSQEAISIYKQVVEREEEIGGVSIHQRIAESLSGAGEFEEALPFFEKALSHRWKLIRYSNMPLLLIKQVCKTAIKKFTELKELDREYHSMYLYLQGLMSIWKTLIRPYEQ